MTDVDEVCYRDAREYQSTSVATTLVLLCPSVTPMRVVELAVTLLLSRYAIICLTIVPQNILSIVPIHIQIFLEPNNP